jgi:hypothetical protein
MSVRTRRPLVGLTGQVAALTAALFAWGAFQGSLDVAMNTQAITVERAQRRPLMSGLHAGWSIGSFVGAPVLAVGVGITLTVHLLILGKLGLLAVGLLTTRMLPDGTAAFAVDRAEGSASRWPGGMLLLGAIAFAGMLCEGAAAESWRPDWWPGAGSNCRPTAFQAVARTN